MQTRKVVAVFDTPEAAQNARMSLLELGLGPEQVSLTDHSSHERTVQPPQAQGTFWSHIKEMFMPDQDRRTLQESLRRGSCVVVATMDDDHADQAIACLERAGAIDLDEQEARWRAEGWKPESDAEPPAAPLADGNPTIPRRSAELSEDDSTARSGDISETGSTTRGAGLSDTDSATQSAELTEAAGAVRVPVVEERLRVGKREVNRGSVRVRSYIVEEPVHEEVRLREEHVDVERRPVNAPARPVVKGSPENLLQERTIEVSETAEQAVVGKEAKVTEEVVVTKSEDERVEHIDDTVRRTKVEIEDGRQTDRSARPASPPRTPTQPRRT
jgi:uncharacterized protein (TIGR02271 family)